MLAVESRMLSSEETGASERTLLIEENLVVRHFRHVHHIHCVLVRALILVRTPVDITYILRT